MKYLAVIFMFLSAFGAVNPQPFIKELKVEDGYIAGKIANVTVGTIVTVWRCENIDDIGKLKHEFFEYSFYGYDEEVFFTFSSSGNVGYCWITQTPYYPAPK